MKRMSSISYRNKEEEKEDAEQICNERQEKRLWNLLDGSDNIKLAW